MGPGLTAVSVRAVDADAVPTLPRPIGEPGPHAIQPNCRVCRVESCIAPHWRNRGNGRAVSPWKGHMPTDWTEAALAYLRGRLDAGRHGEITLASVAAAVRAALASGVNLGQIITELASHGLCWEPETRSVRFC